MKKILLLLTTFSLLSSAVFAGGAVGFIDEVTVALKEIMVSGKPLSSLTKREASTVGRALRAASRVKGETTTVNLSKPLGLEKIIKVEVSSGASHMTTLKISHRGDNIVEGFAKSDIDSIVKDVLHASNQNVDDFVYHLKKSNGGSVVKLTFSYQKAEIVAKILKTIGLRLEEFSTSAAALI